MTFSILIANYNNGKYFEDCYKSILLQNYENWEAVIVDDASTDNSIEIIKKNTWLGIGAGNYVKQKEIVKTDATPYEQPVHNAFLLIFAESGIFAFLSLILFLVFLTKNGRRQNFSLAIIVAIVVLMLFDHWFISLPFGILFFFLILGVI